jgi:hypothetical protein
MKIMLGPAVALALLPASPSDAATVPKVAGKYGIAVAVQCTANVTTTGPGLNRMGGFNGDGVGTMTFPTTASSSGHIAISYSEHSLPSVIIDGDGNGTNPFTKALSGHFKLTASKFTITPTTGDGASGPMSFGALDSNGVAGTLYFHWVDFDGEGGTWCSHILWATKQ